jgi:hypothetical protein
MEIEELKLRIESFSELRKNWDPYDADEITPQSIITSCNVLDLISKTYDINEIYVYPMRNGGIQFEIGDYIEIQILNSDVTEFKFDSDFNIISETKL